MAQTIKDKTFSSYNEEQSRTYAKVRRGYHPNVYAAVLDYHRSTSGQFDNFLDVGCGPGLATQGLNGSFTHVIGIDPSEGMIATACALGLKSATGKPARFEVSTAESLGSELEPPITESSVDLLVVANAAHWFDMTAFWARAAHVLKPAGTVAIWTSGDIRVHPSTPNAAAVQAAIDAYDEEHLKPYYEEGNLLTRNGYRGLALPWTISPQVSAFEERSFIRKEWDVDEDFFVGLPESDMDVFEMAMNSQSAHVRWRDAHADIAGTERDPLKILRAEIERLLHEAGVEEGQERLRGAVFGVLLMIKKRF